MFSSYISKSIHWLLLLLSLSLNVISFDLYLPAMPMIAEELHTSHFLLKLIFIINFIEFSIAPLLLGIFLDIKGRKAAIFLSLGLSTVGQILSSWCSNTYSLMFFRIIQYLGAGALSSIILTLICDNFEGEKRDRAIATFEIALPVSLVLGPPLGAVFLEQLGWRKTFLFIGWVQAFCFLAILFNLPEMPKKKTNIVFKDTLREALNIFKNPLSVRIILILGCTEGPWMIFNISAAFFYIQVFDLSLSAYAYYQMIPIASFLLGATGYSMALKKINTFKLFGVGITGYVFCGGLGILLLIWQIIMPTPLNLCITISVINFFYGVISPSGNSIVLNQANKALLGTSAAIITAVINIIVGMSMLWGSYVIQAELSLAFFYSLLFFIVLNGFLWFSLAVHSHSQ